MSIETIVRNRKGTAGHWRVVQCNSTRTLWHYSTAMLTWRDTGYGVELIDYSTGHGSVSDQNGMNKAFRVLGLGLYFSRAGGAEIRYTSTYTEGIA